jgi:N-dimethylarginine dimethylaminohydrolase
VSEFEAAPVRVLVHDPAQTRAFERLADVPEKELEERYLFRAHPDREAFSREHAALVAALREDGVDIVELRDVLDENGRQRLDEDPNFVYTRDPVITLPWLRGSFIRGAMRKPVRRAEPDVLATAVRALGLRELFAMASGSFLEGGDVIPLARDGRRILLVGFGPRTARAGLDELYERLAPSALDVVVGIELVPERMNLDGALVPVADDTVLIEPSSIVRSFVLDGAGERRVRILDFLRELGMALVEVTRAEATTMQACNCVCVGGRRVVSYDLCARVVAELRSREIEVSTVPGAELIKGTGGPRCMTRPLYA